jgi:hypothetical protein
MGWISAQSNVRVEERRSNPLGATLVVEAELMNLAPGPGRNARTARGRDTSPAGDSSDVTNELRIDW